MDLLPIVRILLRYASGALLSAGVVSPQLANGLATSEDVVMIATGLLGIAVTEVGYILAKRRGGAT